MALSSSFPLTTQRSTALATLKLFPFPAPVINCHFHVKPTIHKDCNLSGNSASKKWRANVSFFPTFLNQGKNAEKLKEDLLEAIAPLDRGAEATPEDQQRVDQVSFSYLVPAIFFIGRMLLLFL